SESVQRSYETKMQGGGPVASAMVTASKLGLRTAMIDSIGDDWCGDLIMKEFGEYGVSTELIRIVEGASSAAATILVKKEDGSRGIVFTPGTASDMPVVEITPEIIRSAKIIHVNGRHLESCMKACELAGESDVKISFDGGAKRYREELNWLIPLTDIFIAAKDFTDSLTNETDITWSAEYILNKGPELVVITDGINGSWIFTESGESFHQPAFIVDNVVDTTGCGDSYHGAFLYGLLNNKDIKETAMFASAAASLNTQALGGRTALPDLNTVKSFLENYNKSKDK
ncbi:MAG: carbohydrate kinase family protein, partial [bacterium]|nr:carbohydrate kinase family protein [bacterium]